MIEYIKMKKDNVIANNKINVGYKKKKKSKR